MATSTFGKQFKVKQEKAVGFVNEMTKKVAPTLKKNFKSNMVHEKDLEEALRKALGQLRDYVVVPLGELINKGYDEEKLENAFKKFSCQREVDLEDFLVHKAITYEKTDYGKTYLCLDQKELYDNHNFVVLAYFALAQRSVDISELSNKRKRKVLGNYPGRDSIRSVPAFLIGQLGRDDSCGSDELSGQQLLNECYHAISLAAKIVGGNLLVLECREHMFPKFYEKQGFKKLYDELNEEDLYTLYKKVNFKEYFPTYNS